MRKMKKVLSLAMTAAMTASLLTGMGAVTASAKKSDDGKRTKITALLFLIYIRKRSSLADIYNYISSLFKKIQQNCDFMTGFCETCGETFRLPAGIS